MTGEWTGEWYVVRTKTGAEERAVWHLKNQGFVAYLPRYRKQVRHARKTQTVLRPLFPGYVFVNMDIGQQRWRAINGTMGVISLVQVRRRPSAHPHRPGGCYSHPRRRCGGGEGGPGRIEKRRPRAGARRGLCRLLEKVSDQKRVFLLLDLMGREVRVSMLAENLLQVS